MAESFKIRESVTDDLSAIENLYPRAFPDEDLLPLVRSLLEDKSIALSLVGSLQAQIVGHVVFTRCSIADHQEKVALLGPLAVAPAHQKQGIGSALVRAGLQVSEDAGGTQIFVLGDPAYYHRFGFSPETRVEPPYPLPEEWRGAWQSIHLGDAGTPQSGKLCVPNAWCDPALWGP